MIAELIWLFQFIKTLEALFQLCNVTLLIQKRRFGNVPDLIEYMQPLHNIYCNLISLRVGGLKKSSDSAIDVNFDFLNVLKVHITLYTIPS